MKEIKDAIEYFEGIDGAISFVNKPEARQKSMFRTAIAALKFVAWIEAHWPKVWHRQLEQKFNDFKVRADERSQS